MLAPKQEDTKSPQLKDHLIHEAQGLASHINGGIPKSLMQEYNLSSILAIGSIVSSCQQKAEDKELSDVYQIAAVIVHLPTGKRLGRVDSGLMRLEKEIDQDSSKIELKEEVVRFFNQVHAKCIAFNPSYTPLDCDWLFDWTACVERHFSHLLALGGQPEVHRHSLQLFETVAEVYNNLVPKHDLKFPIKGAYDFGKGTAPDMVKYFNTRFLTAMKTIEVYREAFKRTLELPSNLPIASS